MIAAIERNSVAHSDQDATPETTAQLAWEYHIEQVRPGLLQQALEALGKLGWELCSTIPATVQASVLQPGAGVPALILIFKRPALGQASIGQAE